MAILIDGYNLLNATGIDGHGTAGRTALERARVALLNFLARALDHQQRAATTIVFDAHQAPPGLPSELVHAEMQVRFARGYPSADDLIEELIAADHVPRRLVVVSSDHRLHRAAQRRRATAIDSDAWMNQLEARRRRAAQPPESTTSDDLPVAASWLAEFGSIDVAKIEEELRNEPQNAGGQDSSAWNPFPPGYAADIDDDAS